MTNQNSRTDTFDHLKTILILPFVVTVVIPFAILHFSKTGSIIRLTQLPIWLALSLGVIATTMGLILFIKSLDLFVKIGKGTLAPWNPTRNIVGQRALPICS